MPDGAAAGKRLLQLDPRFETLLWLTKDLRSAREQLAWDAGYMRWFGAFQGAARAIPEVPRMSVTAEAFLKRVAAQGDADAHRRLDAYQRARIVSEEAAVARSVSLAEARALPPALEDDEVLMGVLALQAAGRLRLELEPRHYLLLALWAGLEAPPARRPEQTAALARWKRRIETVRETARSLERALRARSGGGSRAGIRPGAA